MGGGDEWIAVGDSGVKFLRLRSFTSVSYKLLETDHIVVTANKYRWFEY